MSSGAEKPCPLIYNKMNYAFDQSSFIKIHKRTHFTLRNPENLTSKPILAASNGFVKKDTPVSNT
jgi:hypothetical protein